MWSLRAAVPSPVVSRGLGPASAALMAAADFVLLPSRFEPCGLTDVEFAWKGALGCGFQVMWSLRAAVPSPVVSRGLGPASAALMAAADFVLLPSRFEPCGLTDVEFAWKGALGCGFQVGGLGRAGQDPGGGLGKTPGFYQPLESSCHEHQQQQLLAAINAAMAAPPLLLSLMQTHATQLRFSPQVGTAGNEGGVGRREGGAQTSSDRHTTRSCSPSCTPMPCSCASRPSTSSATWKPFKLLPPPPAPPPPARCPPLSPPQSARYSKPAAAYHLPLHPASHTIALEFPGERGDGYEPWWEGEEEGEGEEAEGEDDEGEGEETEEDEEEEEADECHYKECTFEALLREDGCEGSFYEESRGHSHAMKNTAEDSTGAGFPGCSSTGEGFEASQMPGCTGSVLDAVFAGGVVEGIEEEEAFLSCHNGAADGAAVGAFGSGTNTYPLTISSPDSLSSVLSSALSSPLSSTLSSPLASSPYLSPSYPLPSPSLLLSLFSSVFSFSSLLWSHFALHHPPLTLMRVAMAGTCAAMLLHSSIALPHFPFLSTFNLSSSGSNSSSSSSSSSSSNVLLRLALVSLPLAFFSACSGPVLNGLNFLGDSIGNVPVAERIGVVEALRSLLLLAVLVGGVLAMGERGGIVGDVGGGGGGGSGGSVEGVWGREGYTAWMEEQQAGPFPLSVSTVTLLPSLLLFFLLLLLLFLLRPSTRLYTRRLLPSRHQLCLMLLHRSTPILALLSSCTLLISSAISLWLLNRALDTWDLSSFQLSPSSAVL
ncbi:unnamed protein product [Closterium sp. Naga37s-1]|nr:unnamed protein product [Closterium sp. Naga37s-1]